jgi:hypothetical protein
MTDPKAPVPTLPPTPQGPISVAGVPRRRSGPIVGGIAIVVALIAGAVAFVATQGGGSASARAIALSFTEGQSETYAIYMTMDGDVSSDVFGAMPLEMEMSQVQTWRVTAIDDDGIATIEVSTSEISGSLNGVELPSTQAPSLEFRVAPDGRIVSAGGLALGGASQTQGFGFPGANQLTPILPDEGQEVAPGDTWDKEFSQDFPFGEGAIEFTATSTYERNETVDGREAAVIVTEMTVPMDFTMRLSDLIEALGEDTFGASGTTGLDPFREATIAYGGRGEFTQTSFVDLDAQELLRTRSAGDFEISMVFDGIPGFDGAVDFTGTFTQDLERR